MEILEVLKISGAILSSLGGGAVIVFGFSSWLGKVWANRLMEKEKADHVRELESLRHELLKESESYKVKLKKSEFIFQKEFEAASEFVALRRSFLPTYSHPDMDWYEACDAMALDFGKMEVELGAYLSKHGAVLDAEVTDAICRAIGLAAGHKFEASINRVSSEANKAASRLYENLQEVERSLLSQVRSQSST